VIGVVALGIEHSAAGTILRYALPTQVDQVIFERRAVLPVTNDARFDGDASCPIRQPSHGRDACRPAAAEGGGPSGPTRSTVQAAGLLGCSQYAGDERLDTAHAAFVADAPKPDAEIIVSGHDADARRVREVSSFQVLA
jgi:hypothetical protein